ncbi:pL60L [African swine fever virus]|uniref:PL60L n=1 Tax=African swine fever virus TaxID=10497 RepID=A0A894KSY9_ASF|nr:pL60L [African swine fever virus]
MLLFQHSAIQHSVYQYIYYHYYFYAVFLLFYCCNVPVPPLSGKCLLQTSLYEEYHPYLLCRK